MADEQLMKRCLEKTEQLFSVFTNNPLNYDMLYDILLRTSNYERQIIADEYKIRYNKTVFDEINSLIKDADIKDIVTLMFYNYYELDARVLHKAFKGKKRNEKAIVEIFASRPHWFLQTVDQEYNRIFGISLKDDICKEKKSDFITFVLCILNNPRQTKNEIRNEKQAKDAAQEIISIGLKKYSTDQDLFKNLFVKKTRDDLIKISREFKNLDKKKRNLYDAIDKDCASGTKELLKAILFAVSIPSHYFANLLYYSMKGIGTDEETLNRVLVTRHEIDMEFIRNYYKVDFKAELIDDIKGETSGNYEKICCKLASCS